MKLLYGFLALALAVARKAHGEGEGEGQTPFLSSPQQQQQKVPLEIHIMSKCPDAQACVDLLIAPTLEQVEDLVEFKMSFIGTNVEAGIACKHGPSECVGNTLHLCAAQISTPPDPPPSSRYFGFSHCLLDNYSQVTNKTFVQECSAKEGIDFDKLNGCASDLGDEGGVALLKKSVQRSEDLGIKRSCTVRLDGKVRCVRDGGEWYDCPGGSEVEDLVGDIKKLADADVGEEL